MDSWENFDSGSRAKDTDPIWFETNGASMEITGLQLEVGSQATEFDHRTYAEELALCQRYYHKVSADTGPRWLYFLYNNTSYSRVTVVHPVPMRASPTVSAIDLTNTGSASGVQFNGIHSTTVYVNNPGAISSLNVAQFDSEL